MAKDLKTKRYQQIVSNITPIVRNDRMMEKDYLVVPMVMMVEGVLAGNCGPIMYPFEEMAQIPHIWNSKPVVVYHPETNGVHGSACTPEELTVRSIGTIMNTKAEDGKLKAEAWIDPERVAKVDERILEAIQNQQTLELSTGLYMDVQEVEGEFNGVEYTGIASNFRPDHLAVLPDMEGACSVKDGAGFIRVNMKFTKNELSNNDIRSQLARLVQDSSPDGEWAYVEDVYDSYFIYERENKLYKQEYKVEDDVVDLVGLPTEVVRKMTYEVINEVKGNRMKKKEKLVEEIISNENIRFDESDRETLMAMNEDALEKMIPEIKEDAPAQPEEIQNAAEEGAKEIKPTVNKKTPEDYLKELPKDVQAVLNHGLVTYNKQKAELIETIVGNDRNLFSKEYLQSKDIQELQAIANLAAPVTNEEDTRFDYSGQAPVTVNTTDEEPLALPSTL